MLTFAVFGIDNDALNTAVNVLLLFLVVVWLALVFWTFADARRRIDDPLLIGCATVAALIFPFLGTILYAIVRPPEYLADVRLRALEMHGAEARLHQLDEQLCPYCDHGIHADYLRCPNCARRLKEPCRNCGKPLDPQWRLCPYCETEVAHQAGAANARRSRTAAAAEPPG